MFSDVFPEALFPMALLVREDVSSVPVDDGHQGCELRLIILSGSVLMRIKFMCAHLQHPLVSKRPAAARLSGVVLNINEQNHPPVVNGRSLVGQPCEGTCQGVDQ